MIIHYNPELKELARQLQNNATKAEIRLWQYLKRDQMGYDFHRQKPIGNYIADFYCHDLRLVIEIDGYSHSFEEVATKDLLKESAFEKMELTVIRFDDRDVMDSIDSVLKGIENYISDFEEKHSA